MAIHAKLKTEIINVTPTQAQQWLDKNTRNRQVREERAAQYAEDMKAGRWRFTHQGIAFYADGTLADGQHRLHAITLYGKPVQMLVTRGLPQETGQAIDQNLPRMTHDSIRIGGGPDWIERNVVATTRVLLNYMNAETKTHSVAEIVDYATRYADHIKLSQLLVAVKKRNVTSASIAACYFCALQAGEDKDKIKRFAEIMLNGEIAGPHENAAIRLREFLIGEGARAWMGYARMETAKKVQRAIQLFCEGKATAKLYTPEKLVYPIPR